MAWLSGQVMPLHGSLSMFQTLAQSSSQRLLLFRRLESQNIRSCVIVGSNICAGTLLMWSKQVISSDVGTESGEKNTTNSILPRSIKS